MLRYLIEKIIRYIKNSEIYTIDPNFTNLSLFFEVFYRCKMLFRGFFVSIFYRGLHPISFIGRNVTIKHSNLFSAGRGCIIENNVYIDALSSKGVKLGNNVTLPYGLVIKCTGVIKFLGVGLIIGNNTGLGAYCYINAQGGVEIGENVIMGPYVKIFSENHNFSKNDSPIIGQGTHRKGVKIEDNCWIGANSIILDGVTIRSGVVVAAGSVVTKSIPENVVVAGVPARIIKQR